MHHDFKPGDRVRLITDVVTPGSSRELGTVNVLGREGEIVEARPGRTYVIRVEGKGEFPVCREWIEPAGG